MVTVPKELSRILSDTPELANAYLVGGCVRDALLGIPHKDFDIEVFGVSYEVLAQALSRWGRTDMVGRSFGVVKLRSGVHEFDFTIPRRDSKTGPGHKGFEVSFDPGITPQEAASRRDFTVNALMFDPRTNEILDFFGGITDAQKRVLRHTSDAFVEDPLRVLRGMQFASRFSLEPAPETVSLCRQIKASFRELAAERVCEEWLKWAEKSATPSIGLRFLVATEWIDHFPELKATIGVPQEPEWHPEGDVFTHTCHCCDALVRIPEWSGTEASARQVYMLAVLLHDAGKSVSTRREVQDGKERIISPGHEQESLPLAEKFLERINVPPDTRARVYPLIANHMAHMQVVTDRSVRRLAKRLEPANISDLCMVITADANGRPPKPAQVPRIVTALLVKAEELQVKRSPPAPILLGRHLIELGLQPGPKFKKILDAAYDAQLEGTFLDLDGALKWYHAGGPWNT